MLSEADKKLSKGQQDKIIQATTDYNNATDDAGRKAAHDAAEKVRAEEGYSGGADGSGFTKLSGFSGEKYTPGDSAKSQQSLLSEADQAKIDEYKRLYAEAQAIGDVDAMNDAHRNAEHIRAINGFTGGADGSGYEAVKPYQVAMTNGGYTADEVAEWLAAYQKAGTDNNPFMYENGFPAGMNKRSMANFVRQQMLANSNAWADASERDRALLHDQNMQLATLLEKYNGGAKSTYNEALGRWETADGDLGYGYITNVRGAPEWNNNGDMTPEQREAYANDTSRYYNFIDTDLPRHWVDESSGFTGEYENFVNGPYRQLLGPFATNAAVHTNLIGDGFADEQDYRYYTEPKKNADGSYQLYEPLLKGGNASDYTQSKAAYANEDGIIMPGILDGTKSDTAWKNMWLNGGRPVGEDAGDDYGVTWGHRTAKDPYMMGVTKMDDFLAQHGLGGKEGDSYEAYINSYLDADLKAKLAQLEAQYKQANADLDDSAVQTDSDYYESRRQAEADMQRQMAAWREVANAQGINSGAVGQTILANSGQLQSQINAMNSAEASAQAQIEKQRALLAQSYYLQIQQAEADNDYARAQALLQEAQRVDAVMRQLAQDEAQNQLAYLQLLMG